MQAAKIRRDLFDWA